LKTPTRKIVDIVLFFCLLSLVGTGLWEWTHPRDDRWYAPSIYVDAPVYDYEKIEKK
jgi:hypothetical protein